MHVATGVLALFILVISHKKCGDMRFGHMLPSAERYSSSLVFDFCARGAQKSNTYNTEVPYLYQE
jgi:hypothetical protein